MEYRDMRVVVIGATGTIGKAIAQALTARHDVVSVSRHSEPRVNVEDPKSIDEMYQALARVDAVICAAGEAKFAPLAQLTDEDFAFSVRSKLLGQANVIRLGLAQVADGGSITVTSGTLATQPSPGSGAVSLVNAGLEGFVRAAALEAPRGIRVNVVSPPWVTETLQALGMPPAGGLPAAVVAQAYVRSLEGTQTGAVLHPAASS
jgi:NAD(P)-dependent dehydrogenase (short-subunit alcohol dehydrogenase family)